MKSPAPLALDVLHLQVDFGQQRLKTAGLSLAHPAPERPTAGVVGVAPSAAGEPNQRLHDFRSQPPSGLLFHSRQRHFRWKREEATPTTPAVGLSSPTHATRPADHHPGHASLDLKTPRHWLRLDTFLC